MPSSIPIWGSHWRSHRGASSRIVISGSGDWYPNLRENGSLSSVTLYPFVGRCFAPTYGYETATAIHSAGASCWGIHRSATVRFYTLRGVNRPKAAEIVGFRTLPSVSGRGHQRTLAIAGYNPFKPARSREFTRSCISLELMTYGAAADRFRRSDAGMRGLMRFDLRHWRAWVARAVRPPWAGHHFYVSRLVPWVSTGLPPDRRRFGRSCFGPVSLAARIRWCAAEPSAELSASGNREPRRIPSATGNRTA